MLVSQWRIADVSSSLTMSDFGMVVSTADTRHVVFSESNLMCLAV